MRTPSETRSGGVLEARAAAENLRLQLSRLAGVLDSITGGRKAAPSEFPDARTPGHGCVLRMPARPPAPAAERPAGDKCVDQVLDEATETVGMMLRFELGTRGLRVAELPPEVRLELRSVVETAFRTVAIDAGGPCVRRSPRPRVVRRGYE